MKTIEETIKEIREGKIGYTGRIGYVYPDDEEGYYIHANLGYTDYVECTDGSLYAEVE
jgi:hypothetical protein